jgi:hypothetical protein
MADRILQYHCSAKGVRIMLLQTNSYIVPKDKRTEHARLIKRFRQVMSRLGLDDYEVYEQAGPNWSTEVGGRFVQIMRFRDREHQQQIRTLEQSDPTAQELVREFMELINFPYQHQQGLATTAFYIGLASGAPMRRLAGDAKPLNANGSIHHDEVFDENPTPDIRNSAEPNIPPSQNPSVDPELRNSAAGLASTEELAGGAAGTRQVRPTTTPRRPPTINN